MCIVEGARELGRALGAGQHVESVLVGDSPAPSISELASVAQLGGAGVFELSEAAFAKVSLRRHPADIIGIVEVPGSSVQAMTAQSPALVLVADAIEKPGNLGAMIRSADGAGADAVIASDLATDLGNPNIIRASQGAVFGFPCGTGSAPEVTDWLDANGITPLVATDEAGEAFWDADLTGPTAIVIGSEDGGVSRHWRTHGSVSIPMHGMSDSLNASVAAALILYEARRQRRSGADGIR